MPESEPTKIIPAILFSDISGYSRMREGDLRAFLTDVLPKLAEQVVDRYRHDFLHLNTWGDAIIAVCTDPEAIIEFAFSLRDFYSNQNWEYLRLPELSVRIAIHAGPVFIGHDPILEKDGIIGTQVNLAARLEPVAIPGHIWVTERFRQLFDQTPRNFTFDDLGEQELAKSFGSIKAYHFRREREKAIDETELTNLINDSFTDVELIVQTEKLTPLEGANIQFISKGAPEPRLTDSNGYSRIRIPSRGDVEIILSKDGFETVRQIINLGVDSNRTRVYQLKEIVSNSPSNDQASDQASPSPNPFNTPLSPGSTSNVAVSPTLSGTSQEQEGFLFQLTGCQKRSDRLFLCNLEVRNLQEKSRELTLWTGGSRIIDSTGNEIPAIEARLGSPVGTGNASTIVPSNILMNGSVSLMRLLKGM